MKLEVGMYAKTKVGEIYKCLLIYIDDNNPTLNRFMNEWGNMIMFDEIKGEPSHNIIDLIEVGDYVNGIRVGYINKGEDYLYALTDENTRDVICGYDSDGFTKPLYSIVIKEQFEQMQYKVGDW